ncbi:MAG: pyruvate kinase [Alphaproteobacteria bacterium]|nr:pyruvate kinase [Alphaproteobacteria bacterium]
MVSRRHVKIIATLGPSSSTPEGIRALIDAGADLFRINMSHADHETLRRLVGMIRNAEAAIARPIGILADLQGPKLRCGRFAGGKADLAVGARFRLDLDPAPGDATRVGLPHPEIFKALEPGSCLLLNDGKIRLRVTEAAEDHAATVVEVGGVLSDRKGVNVPDVVLPLSALSEKDRSDLSAALDAGVDWIALSFVQRPDDVAEARKAVGGQAGIMAKIEKPAALTHLDEIITLSDALMVARGDLGVELPIEQVPGWQKRITRACRRAGRPVVVATQMLESMIEAPVPTRAEVSDVSTAVFEGADAVMLSAESASGRYPVEAVTMMDRIGRTVETDPNYRAILDAQRTEPEATTPDAIMHAARLVTETLRIPAIVCYTNSGSTALRAARERPDAAILALTPRVETARRLRLAWGVTCVTTEDARDFDDMIERACRIAFKSGVARAGQRIVVTAGVPLGTPGATNLLRIAFVGGRSGSDSG